MFKRIACIIIIILSITIVAVSCKKSPENTSYEDILSQKVSDESKIPISILVKNAFTIKTFEKVAEEKFPELDIIQVGNYTSDMGIAEYEARLEHDDITDMVMTWPLEVGEQYWEDRLMELSTLPFTDRYVTSMLEGISREGKLYYLPGPSQVRGIVYNKTLFNENGWEVPKNFDGFIELCNKIEKSGIRSLQLGLKNSEVLDTAFFGFGYGSSLGKPQNAQWLTNYNNGKGSFKDNFSTALNTYQKLIDAGVLNKNDLNVDYSKREEMIFNRKCAMIEDSVLIARKGQEYNGCTDEFALMPFFNPENDGDWARLYSVCYIGVNKKMEQPENKKKLEIITKLLEYISTEEGQNALVADTGAMFSSLKNVAPPDIPEIKELIPALTNGRYGVFPKLKKSQDALRKGLSGMLAEHLDVSTVIDMVDKENALPPIITPSEKFGEATDNFNVIDTGNFITDTMIKHSGCEIALFLDNGKDGRQNGKGVSSKIYKGDITKLDIKRIMPDFKLGEKGELLRVSMTGKNLIMALEYSITVNNNQNGWFYYFSGLKMEYSPTSTQGQRVKKITDNSGKAIDSDKVYNVAIMAHSVNDEYIIESESTNILISTMLEQEIKTSKQISPSKDGRFIVVNP